MTADLTPTEVAALREQAVTALDRRLDVSPEVAETLDEVATALRRVLAGDQEDG